MTWHRDAHDSIGMQGFRVWRSGTDHRGGGPCELVRRGAAEAGLEQRAGVDTAVERQPSPDLRWKDGEMDGWMDR
eukprot:1869986-Rhodomonas_salina.1